MRSTPCPSPLAGGGLTRGHLRGSTLNLCFVPSSPPSPVRSDSIYRETAKRLIRRPGHTAEVESSRGLSVGLICRPSVPWRASTDDDPRSPSIRTPWEVRGRCRPSDFTAVRRLQEARVSQPFVGFPYEIQRRLFICMEIECIDMASI